MQGDSGTVSRLCRAVRQGSRGVWLSAGLRGDQQAAPQPPDGKPHALVAAQSKPLFEEEAGQRQRGALKRGIEAPVPENSREREKHGKNAESAPQADALMKIGRCLFKDTAGPPPRESETQSALWSPDAIWPVRQLVCALGPGLRKTPSLEPGLKTYLENGVRVLEGRSVAIALPLEKVRAAKRPSILLSQRAIRYSHRALRLSVRA